jgi:hypothetical protein
MAWMTVICVGIAFILSIIAVTILYFKIGFPRASGGLGFMGLSGLAGLAPVVFKKEKGAVELDERDRMIQLQATKAGFAASYGVFGILAMGIWTVKGHDQLIDINILPQIWMTAFITAFFVQSLTTLILYGKDNKITEGGVI